MASWEIVGFMGTVFAMVYRMPQIYKIWSTKRADDISTSMFLIHNWAYICLIIYLLGREIYDMALLSYYCIGILQNWIIVALTCYYSASKPVADETSKQDS